MDRYGLTELGRCEQYVQLCSRNISARHTASKGIYTALHWHVSYFLPHPFGRGSTLYLYLHMSSQIHNGH